VTTCRHPVALDPSMESVPAAMLNPLSFSPNASFMLFFVVYLTDWEL